MDETPDASPAAAETSASTLARDIDLVDQILGHRLHQGDIKRLLANLPAADREDFTVKLADILRKTSALLEVSKKVSDTLSLDVLLPRMVAIVSEFLAADRCTLFLNDRGAGELYSRVAQGDLTTELRFPNHLGIAGSVFQSGEALLIPDAYADSRFNPEIDKKTGYRTRNILCCPIRTVQGEVVGVAQVLNKRDGDFDDDDLRLLQSITQQAAAAFINAQLHEQIGRARAEEQKLLEITNAISRELSIEPLLQKIMEAVTEILSADRSTLFMYDAKKDELWSHVAQGVGITEIRFPAHLGIAGTVFKTATTINIPDAYADERFNPAVDKKTGYKTDTILCMPVINKQGAAIGVVQVLNKKGGTFGPLDEQRLRAFSSQASIAIENAQLFEEVVRVKNYNESILESMSNGVLTVSADGTIVTANRAALWLFRRENSPAEIIGRTVADFFVDENQWVGEMIARVRNTGKPDTSLDADLHLRQTDAPEDTLPQGGERRREVASLNLTVVPLSSGKGQSLGALLMMEDITNEKRLRGTMARYMTKEVADKLLEEGEAVLGGKMQKTSVLFTDIRGFTSISERIGAHETVKMLNEYFSIMVDVILEHNGILDKYIGDAIMAVFGAPFATDMDADNALKTAIGMLKALRRFNADRVAAGGFPVHMGIGINTAEVLSGNIGSLKRMDYTVIGDGVNLASRLESANKHLGTNVLISEFTVRELKGLYLLREVDKIRVKGKTQPVAVFEALDHHDALTFPHLDVLLEMYNNGLAFYQQRNFAKAEQIFHDALLIAKDDAVTRHYLDRCRHFVAQPPPDDWDGVFVMKDK
ncbi:MAG: GAF domain-containing protein [Deltaproteobacteria bacterium]|nr:GAF domain-containing protein [Deltaproteobacteria bacterium]